MGDTMAIHYFRFEAVPLADNPEGKLYKGALVNCWVNSRDEELALNGAINYVRDNEGWEVIRVEEQSIADRSRYEGDSELEESLECFDQAVRDGIGVILYTWDSDDEEDDM